MTEKLGDRIRAARERLGLTQAELGEAVDVARETVGNWETGVTSPRNKLGKLRAVLGEELDGNVRPSDQDGGVLLDMPREVLEGLSPAERDEVITAAKLSALQTAREIRRRLDE